MLLASNKKASLLLYNQLVRGRALGKGEGQGGRAAVRASLRAS